MTTNFQSEYAKLNQIRDDYHRFSAFRKGDTLDDISMYDQYGYKMTLSEKLAYARLIQSNHTVSNMKFPVKHFTFSIFSTIR